MGGPFHGWQISARPKTSGPTTLRGRGCGQVDTDLGPGQDTARSQGPHPHRHRAGSDLLDHDQNRAISSATAVTTGETSKGVPNSHTARLSPSVTTTAAGTA